MWFWRCWHAAPLPVRVRAGGPGRRRSAPRLLRYPPALDTAGMVIAEAGLQGASLTFLPRNRRAQVPSSTVEYGAVAGIAQDIIPPMDRLAAPSVVRVPHWIPSDRRAHPTAKFYLYTSGSAADGYWCMQANPLTFSGQPTTTGAPIARDLMDSRVTVDL